MLLTAVWQAIADVNNLLNDPEWIDRQEKVGSVMVATGNFLIEDAQRRRPQPMGAAAITDDFEADETITQLTQFIDSQGVAIPMAAPNQDRIERIKQLLEIAIPLLLKFVLKV